MSSLNKLKTAKNLSPYKLVRKMPMLHLALGPIRYSWVPGTDSWRRQNSSSGSTIRKLRAWSLSLGPLPSSTKASEMTSPFSKTTVWAGRSLGTMIKMKNLYARVQVSQSILKKMRAAMDWPKQTYRMPHFLGKNGTSITVMNIENFRSTILYKINRHGRNRIIYCLLINLFKKVFKLC